MTRTQANVALSAILETLDNKDSASSTALYIALQCVDASVYTLEAYERLIGFCKAGALVTVDHLHMVTITAAGRQMAAKCRAART